MFKAVAESLIERLDSLIPKKRQVAFFVTARTSWDPNQQIVYTRAKTQFPVIVVDGNQISKTSVLSTLSVFWKLARSKVIVFDHSLPFGLCVDRHYCINVWHGSPVKKIRALLKGRFTDRFLEYQSAITDLLVANSPYDANVMATSFRLPLNKVVDKGLPRNDYLSCTDEELPCIDIYSEHIKLKSAISDADRSVLWAPTYRGDSHQSNDPINLTSAQISRLDKVLRENNAVLLVRYHKFSSSNDNELFKLDRVIDVTGFRNSNVILREVDMLVTDYSSIWIDFLYTKKPIIIYSPDRLSYTSEHGFVQPFMESIPSKPLEGFEDFLAELDSQLRNPVLPDRHEIMFNRYFGEHNGGSATDYILNCIRHNL